MKAFHHKLLHAVCSLLGSALISVNAAASEQERIWEALPERSPAVPSIAASYGAVSPLDHFVIARLEQEGLQPAAELSRSAWLRRVTFDLSGLPPTPEEVRAFVADRRPDRVARAAVVDRLLASPRYGERWARHWLDVVRYGDTDGFAIDKERSHLWRYRDYVVRAFNDGRPFDQFVREQLAGDLLPDAGTEGLIATSFYRLGPYEQDNMVRQYRRQDFLNEMTAAIGSAFLGLTLQCARCHDHKYDPISMRDFYALQAFLTPLERGTRDAPFLPEESTDYFARSKLAAESRLADLKDRRESIRESVRTRLAEKAGTDDAKVTDEELDAAFKKRPLGDDTVPTKAEEEEVAEIGKILERFQDTERYEPLVDTLKARDPKQVKPARILLSGDAFQEGPEVEPSFPEAARPWDDPVFALLRTSPTKAVPAAASATAGETAPASAATETGKQDEEETPVDPRRLALAAWVASPRNPLTARVIVNRVWQYHLGRGLVATPNDFGQNGAGVSHPELLDYLTHQFIEDGWRLKPLHRRIVLSRTYRLAQEHADRERAAEVDPENRLLWRAHPRRLEAETLRDAMLAVAGELDLVVGGPGFLEEVPPEVSIKSPFFYWHMSSASERRRRSIYMFHRRNFIVPFLEAFDAADMTESCSRRGRSVTTPQVLTLLNSSFTTRLSRSLAERVRAEAADDAAAQVTHLFQLALARTPQEEELAAALEFLAEAGTPGATAGVRSPTALAELARVVLNTNEFLYLD